MAIFMITDMITDRIKDRITEEFLELVRIDSPSLKERKMADSLIVKLRDMGLEVYEDDAGVKVGGECGNIIATLKGDRNLPVVAMLAHMDTVCPCVGKKPVVDGDIIRSDGTTILGGDDVAGIIVIMETVRGIIRGNVRHGDIHAIFTIGEELALLGARNLDTEKLNIDYAFIVDNGGPAGTVAYAAPSQITMEIGIKGKAAHAGVEPEKGISAIEVFAKAVSGMKLGRIDAETTANIGIVNGGSATNVICENLTAKAEARSLDEKKLAEQAAHMEKRFADACADFGAELSFKSVVEYRAFNIDHDSMIFRKLRDAARKLGIEIALHKTGGGSDTNILNEIGITAVNISCGMFNAHSKDEYTDMGIVRGAIELMIETFKEFGGA
jgi:tripeptide aminopeptidase